VVSRLLLALTSTVVVVVALEGLLRVTGLGVHTHMIELARYGAMLEQDAGGYPRHRRSTTFRTDGIDMRFNSLGMRDDEPVVPKPAGTRRLLLLGDSVVVGPGVPQEDILGSRLRRLLAPRGVDLVTGAVSGWNTVFEEMFVATNLPRLAPDVVVLVYVMNDDEPIMPFDRERQPPASLGEETYRWLLVHSRLFEWGVFVYRRHYPDLENLARMTRRKQARERAGVPFARINWGWLASRAALTQIARAARTAGAPFLVVFFRYGPGDLPDRVWRRLTEFSAASGVPLVDTAPWFADRPAPSFFVRPLNPHPSAEAHDRLARGILAALDEQGLLGDRTAPAVPAPGGAAAPQPAP
jgi:hypothetical protein